MGTSNLSEEEAAEEYFRINVTIPFLDQVVASMKARFEDGQSLVVEGTMLIPACVITEPDWKSQIQRCVDMYMDDLPSKRTLDAELDLWAKWTKEWEDGKKKFNSSILRQQVNA